MCGEVPCAHARTKTEFLYDLCTPGRLRAKCASASTIARGWLRSHALEASVYATPCAQRRGACLHGDGLRVVLQCLINFILGLADYLWLILRYSIRILL